MGNLAYENEMWEELLNGEIVCMSPRPAVRHNIVAENIFTIFRRFLKGKSCTAFSDGYDVHLTENDTVIPDVMIICNRDIIKVDGIYGVPDLIVEVLSFSTAKRDKGYKKEVYEKCGVKEYWIVDTESQSIEVYLLKNGKLVLDEIYAIIPDYILEKMFDKGVLNKIQKFSTSLHPDMIIDLKEVFAEYY